jgi:hypothetical protein
MSVSLRLVSLGLIGLFLLPVAAMGQVSEDYEASSEPASSDSVWRKAKRDRRAVSVSKRAPKTSNKEASVSSLLYVLLGVMATVTDCNARYCDFDPESIANPTQSAGILLVRAHP